MTAIQQVPARRLDAASAVDPSSWLHVQWVYHGDQDRALCEVVRPLVRELYGAGLVDGFYFIRYELGGPHLRLRWHLTEPGDARLEAEVIDRIRDASTTWFDANPSPESWAEDKIRRVNRQITGRDPEHDDESPIFADHSLHKGEMRFEVKRYGGPEVLPLALDLFSYSSLQVLDTLVDHRRGRPSFNPRVLGELIRSAFALAGDEEELFALVGYGKRFFGSRFDACLEQADRTFDRGRDGLTRMAQVQLTGVADLLSNDAPSTDADLSRLVADGLRSSWIYALRLGERSDSRWYAASSLLHMTANRLGVLNPEEVYWCRLAEAACRAFKTSDPEAWGELWRARAASPVPTRPLAAWQESAP